MNKADDKIFKNGSTTYYFSSIFFPPKIRREVTKFYSFVRVVDDYVDQVPSDRKGFMDFRELWERGRTVDYKKLKGNPQSIRVIKNMRELELRYDLDKSLMDDFMSAMESDLDHKPMKSLKETEAYMHGSAEVIGLVMAKILGLPKEANLAAGKQGLAFQMINFVRDVAEDISLGRQYIPSDLLAQFGFKQLSQKTAEENPEQFAALIRSLIDTCKDYQKAANPGLAKLPYRYKVAIVTARDLYFWALAKIAANPQIVFSKKVKPSRFRAVTTGLWSAIKCLA